MRNTLVAMLLVLLAGCCSEPVVSAPGWNAWDPDADPSEVSVLAVIEDVQGKAAWVKITPLQVFGVSEPAVGKPLTVHDPLCTWVDGRDLYLGTTAEHGSFVERYDLGRSGFTGELAVPYPPTALIVRDHVCYVGSMNRVGRIDFGRPEPSCSGVYHARPEDLRMSNWRIGRLKSVDAFGWDGDGWDAEADQPRVIASHALPGRPRRFAR